MTDTESPFACDMTAIAPEQRGAHIAAIERLFRSAQNMRELPDGYAFELPNELLRDDRKLLQTTTAIFDGLHALRSKDAVKPARKTKQSGPRSKK